MSQGYERRKRAARIVLFFVDDLIDGAWLGNWLRAEHGFATFYATSLPLLSLRVKAFPRFLYLFISIKVFPLDRLAYYSLLIERFFHARELEHHLVL